MKNDSVSTDQFVRDILRKWEAMHTAPGKKGNRLPVVTLCMEPGSGGLRVAGAVAEHLGFDLFHRDIVHQIALSARSSDAVIDSLEKGRLSGVEDFISSLVQDNYLHPDYYLEHLMKVVSTIGTHGRAVIVGRGANFILPADEAFNVRVIAPLEIRIANVARTFDAPPDVAKRRILIRESRRRAFVRRSFNADISDPCHYDLTVNTGRIGVDGAVGAVLAALDTVRQTAAP